MNTLLRQLIASSHPDSVKSSVGSTVIEKISKQQIESECSALLGTCQEWILDDKNTICNQLAVQLLNKIAENLPAQLDQHFTAESLIGFFAQRDFDRLPRAFEAVKQILLAKKKNDLSVQYETDLLSRYIDLIVNNARITPKLQVAIASLAAALPECGTNALVNNAVRWLARVTVESHSHAAFDEFVQTMVQMIDHVITLHADWGRAMLQTLIEVLHRCESELVSDSLSALLALSSVRNVAANDWKLMSSDDSNDAILGEMRLMILLSRWPLTNDTCQWPMLIYRRLIMRHKFECFLLLAHRIPFLVPHLVQQMYIPALREGALTVLENYLLGYQHSAYAFHTNLNHITNLLMHLLKEKQSNDKEVPPNDSTTPMEVDSNNKQELFTLNYHSLKLLHEIYADVVKEPAVVEYSSKEEVATKLDPVLNRFIELIYVLTERHTGHPELYRPVLELIHEYVSVLVNVASTNQSQPRPSALTVKRKLDEAAWTNASELQMIARESVEDMEMMSLSDSSSRTSLFPERGDKDMIGLNNMGNTCYMNSFLQVLNMTDQLRLELFDLDFQHIKGNKGYKFGPADSVNIYRNLQLLMGSLLLSKRRAITPASFLKSLPDWWRTGRQQDSGEFGRFLFDQLDNAVKLPLPKKDKLELTSAVNDVFGGTTKTLITCSKCNTVSARKESIIDLSIAFPPSSETPDGTLDDLIQYNYDSAGEVLEGDNAYSCETCQEHTRAMKKTVLYVAPEDQAPKHLLITLNRFSYDYKTSTRSKLMTQVSYPEFLQVPVYYDATESKLDKKHVVYVLYGVVMHAGQSAEYGHYYSYARHSYSTVLQCFESPLVVGDEPRLSSTWYRFNDEVVDRSDLASFTQISKHFSNDVPYMLFYVRADHVPDQPSLNKLLSPELPHWLVEEVDKDNEKFAKERTNTTRAVNPWANKKYDWWQDPDKDNDNTPWRPGSGGGNGGFGGGLNHAVF